jgi:hypothetical protein
MESSTALCILDYCSVHYASKTWKGSESSERVKPRKGVPDELGMQTGHLVATETRAQAH